MHKTSSEIFATEIDPYLSVWPSITLTNEEVEKIEKWANEKAKVKLSSGEKSHLIDGEKEVKRNITGQSGEVAVEKFLGIPFVDWNIGPSKNFAHPDIGIMGLGVKTVEYGKLPVIVKNSTYPEIICIKRDNTIYIAGVGFPAQLNKYQDDSYILDKNLKNRNAKTCFYGFSYLKDIRLYKPTVA